MKIIVCIFIIIINISFCLAQSDASSDTVINSGWVIAFGQLLNRPYRISMLDDTVYINGIKMPMLDYHPLPSYHEPTVPVKTDSGDAISQKMHAFNTRVGDLCRKWKKKYKNNDIKVKEMLMAFIDTQHIARIKEYVFYGSGVKITYGYRLKDIYQNPLGDERQSDTRYFEIYLWLPINIKADSDQYLKMRESDDELQEEKQEPVVKNDESSENERYKYKLMLNLIISTLGRNGLFFINKREMIPMIAGNADCTILFIKGIIAAQMFDSMKIKEISRILLNIPPESAMEVLKNSDSWKDIEK